MHLFVIQRILGILLMVFSLTMLPPLLVSFIYIDIAFEAFFESFAVILISGIVLWLPVKRQKSDLRLRDGFLVVALFWTILSLFGSIPFLLSPEPHISFTDAVFEAVSGLTTTGATVIIGLDNLPPSLLFYRQQLQWLGGAGVIVLAIAILPMLGIGGMQMFRAETAGPMKDEKITPRIMQTARTLWGIYVGLTIICALSYWIAGMSAFDAIAHSFSTVSTAGFSTYDASLGHFNNVAIETVAMVFMLLGGISFNIHFMVLRSRNPAIYWRDTQVWVFLLIVALLCLLVSTTLYWSGQYIEPLDALRHGSFQVVSVMTTTGFGTDDFSVWPLFLPVLLIFSSFLGGCAGSTSGGIKIIRFIVLSKEGSREMWRLLHPKIIRQIKIGGHPISERVIDAVWGFFSLYVVSFALIMLLVMATGVDQVTAFGAVAASINNLGPGLGDVGGTFESLNDTAIWLCSFAMLLGRLEIFTLLVLLSPAFWRR
ncbi:MAG: TrkH family potassium uptake protein [Thiohalophilus sp.]|jgi:trk system potassium uptake protein TrkH